MKKFATIALAVVLSMGILTGCGSSKKAAEATTEVKEETVDYGQGLNEDGTLEGVKATDYVTVCDYSALKIPKKEVKVSDSDVQTEIDTILSSYNQVTDRKVKKGDTVNIDYKGMVDGKEFDGGTASGASLKIGSGTFIDGAAGWLESAYAQWTIDNQAEGYTAYIKKASQSDSAYARIDNELIRKYKNYYRVDAVGLAAGDYVIKVVPVKNGKEVTDKAQVTKTLNVSSYDRSGFAFSSESKYKTGSGKTVVATIALINTVIAGYQGALMAPTEVLARQHYESFVKGFEKAGLDIRVELLVGSMTAKQKKEAYARIADGTAGIIVGTHALIQEKVEYKELALVITDEQHRFGVNQRRDFSQKGKSPHILVMSATPIPRTLAIILYGDLDISIIDEMPANRLPIKNCVVDESYRPKAYTFIHKQVASGRQCYVICPMVEDSEAVEAENVVDYTAMLKKELPDIRIEYLHGKMRPSLKNEVMERFAAHETDVLVSTTVIEVGVNVPITRQCLRKNFRI